MASEIGKYVSAYTDFGFKRLFGTELNKELLISFLNSFLNLKDKIVDLSYISLEQLGVLPFDKNAILGTCCKTSDDSYIIVQIQNALPVFIKARSLFHGLSFISNQAPQGVFDNSIKAVYSITLVGCKLDDESDSYLHEVVLYDKCSKAKFCDNIAYYYIELSKFTKNEDELETIQDKWMYAIKNLSDLKDKPSTFKEDIFTKLFEIALIANFTDKEKSAYKASLMKMWNSYSTVESCYEEGLRLGQEEGMKLGLKQTQIKIARKMKQNGMNCEDIFNLTGLKEGQY